MLGGLLAWMRPDATVMMSAMRGVIRMTPVTAKSSFLLITTAAMARRAYVRPSVRRGKRMGNNGPVRCAKTAYAGPLTLSSLVAKAGTCMASSMWMEIG
jgi:hypothetical protein